MDDIMGKIQEMLSDEESMRQIKELADMLSDTSEENNTENNQTNNPSNNSSGFDMGMIFKIQQLMTSAKSDKNTELIMALKPHLSNEKQEKADKALKLMKIFNIFETLKESGMLKDLNKMI